MSLGRIKGGVMGGRNELFLTQIFGDLYGCEIQSHTFVI